MSAGRLTVLLIEDDPADVFLVRELLHEANATIDLRVTTRITDAADILGADDRDATGAGRIDCVLLDLVLPDASGLDGLRRLLSLTVTPPAICVLTGFGEDYLGLAAVAEGAQDYLVKGEVTGAMLVRAVRYAVERRRAEENIRRLREIELRQEESDRLERGLLPQPLLRSDRLAAYPFYRPGRAAAHLGGDFYDVVQTHADRVCVVVGDVSGHGVDEAALGVELRVAWRALVLAGVAEQEIIPALEQVLVSERREENVFATAAMVTIDLAEPAVTVRLAGHHPPLLLRAGQAHCLPADYSPVLGVFPEARRPATRTTLGPATWAVLLFTDGLIEARTGTGEQRLGIDGLRHLLTGDTAAAVGPARLPRWIVDQVERANGGPLIDDVAMLLVTDNVGSGQS